METRQASFAVRGTVMHTPARGETDVLEDALVVVDDEGTIAAVHEADAPGHAAAASAARERGALVELGRHAYLLPGLVDLHIHAPQWPQLGKALHLPLQDWLLKCTFPLEAKYADTAFAERIYASLVDTLLANGTTTAVYFATIHQEATRRLAEICLERGQRALVGKVAMDHREQCPDYYRDDSAAAAIDGTVALIEFVRALPGNQAALVRPIITPRFVPSCSDDLLQGLGTVAAESRCWVQTHCSESDWQHDFVRRRLGKSDTRGLHEFGLMRRGTVLAHSNFIDVADMELIAGAGAGIAHCPLSNFYFANSAFPLRAALEKGVHVGLGTDISGGPNPSILDSCRHAIAASRALEDGVDPDRSAQTRGRPGSRIDFRDAFWTATVGGGRVLDLPIGMFAEGYRFDAMVVDAAVPDSNLIVWDDVDSLEDVFQKIVYTADRTNVRKVWVEGALVVDKDRGA